MIDPFLPFLARAGIVILDGALATELERRGADLRDPLWSASLLVDDPGLIREVHYDYFRAGADVATTASYQATFPGFARRGLSHQQAAELMRRSVHLAREARDRFWSEPAHRVGRLRPLIAASIGCYGAFLADGSEYRGHYGLSLEQLMDFHRPRLDVLADSGPDLLACETIPCLAEAEALVRLLAEYPDVPAWLSFSCCDGQHVCHGEKLSDCVAVAGQRQNVVAVGVNCTPPQLVPELLRSVTEAGKLLLAYPNSGETWDAAARCWQPAPDPTADWARMARDWFDAGARLIGGCCRTTPHIIARIAAALRPPTANSGAGQ